MSEYLIGNTISALDETTFVEMLSDIFLISEHDIYNYTDYNSKYAVLSVIVEKCKHIINNEIGIGSMAYKESADYSVISHNHNDKYNKMHDIVVDFHPESQQDIQNYLSIGNYFIDGRISTVYCPVSCFGNIWVIDRALAEPLIGTIKFNADHKINDISISAENFDGWVYPDGKTYQISDFVLSSQIKTVYGIDDKFFKVPYLDRFVKADNIGKTMCDYDSNTPLPPHTHLVDLAISGNADIEAGVPIGVEWGHGYAFHWGGTNFKNLIQTNSFNVKCGININTGQSVRVQPFGTIGEYSNPAYRFLPVLVYIGKSRYSV